MAQSVKCLLYKHEDLSSISGTQRTGYGKKNARDRQTDRQESQMRQLMLIIPGLKG